MSLLFSPKPTFFSGLRRYQNFLGAVPALHCQTGAPETIVMLNRGTLQRERIEFDVCQGGDRGTQVDRNTRGNYTRQVGSADCGFGGCGGDKRVYES
jgi:hypothetical protein